MESEREFMPSLFVRGTFYQVGFDTGKTFKAMIEDYVEQSDYLNEELLPAYNSTRGQLIYQDILDRTNRNFPQYVRELTGISEGSGVPFHKLMLLHIDYMVLPESVSELDQSLINGCTTIMCNQEDVILGHTEDALKAADNHCYIVHADITDYIDGVEHREKFSSLCYAGHLPGFCMNVNHHGFVYTVNVVQPAVAFTKKSPRQFLTRALLAAKNLIEAETILKDTGTGTSLGLCVNMAFLNQEPIIFYSTEVGPTTEDVSQLSTLAVLPGEGHYHCNMYLRLKIAARGDFGISSSHARHRVLDSVEPPKTLNDVIDLLSNQDDITYPIHRQGKLEHPVATIATGVFDFKRRLWLVYVGKPNSSSPIATFPLDLK